TNYHRAREHTPRARGIRLRLGDLYQAAGEPEKALEAYRQELSLNPGDATALSKVGTALLDQGRLEEAAEHLKKSVELAPEAPSARVSYGRCLLEMNQVPQ